MNRLTKLLLYTWRAKVEIYTYGSYLRCLFDAFVRMLKKHIRYAKYFYCTIFFFTFAVLFISFSTFVMSYIVRERYRFKKNMYFYLVLKPQGLYLESASSWYSYIVTKRVGIVVDPAFESRSEWRDVFTHGLCFNGLAL